MRLKLNEIHFQTQSLVESMVRKGLIDIAGPSQPALIGRIERLLEHYDEQVSELEEEASSLVGGFGMDEERMQYKAFKSLARDAELPIGSDALEYLIKKIEDLLWDDEDVDEIYAEPRQLVAAINPFLKQMSRKRF
jgi:hypothetical protein